MEKKQFKFTASQRRELLKCWAQNSQQQIAEQFLNDAEFRIECWFRNETTKPHTAAAQTISITKRLDTAATEMLAALNEMPSDVAELLNVAWIHEAYGKEHMQRIHNAYDADRKSKISRMYECFAAGIAGNEPPPRKSEVDKLPPDFLKQLQGVKEWLNPLACAARGLSDMVTKAKQWNSRELEEHLILSLAIGYQECFSKPPSSANGSSFRRFAKELSGVLTGYEFGAIIVKRCCDFVAHRKDLTGF